MKNEVQRIKERLQEEVYPELMLWYQQCSRLRKARALDGQFRDLDLLTREMLVSMTYVDDDKVREALEFEKQAKASRSYLHSRLQDEVGELGVQRRIQETRLVEDYELKLEFWREERYKRDFLIELPGSLREVHKLFKPECWYQPEDDTIGYFSPGVSPELANYVEISGAEWQGNKTTRIYCQTPRQFVKAIGKYLGRDCPPIEEAKAL